MNMFIDQEWKNFLNKFTVGDPTVLQKVDFTGDRAEFYLRIAFYSGFAACMGTMNNIVEGDDEEAQCAKVGDMMNEIDAFSEWQNYLGKKYGIEPQRVSIRAGKDEH